MSVQLHSGPELKKFSVPKQGPNDEEESTEEASLCDIIDVRQRTNATITRAIESGDRILVNAPPGSGKTYGVFDVAAATDTPITYLTQRRELYRDAIDRCEENGLSYFLIPVPHEDCPCFDDEEHPGWSDLLTTLHSLGVSGGELHSHFDLPCDGECEYMSNKDYTSEKYDALIGYYTQAYAAKNIRRRQVVLDEFTSYISKVESVDKKVTAFLKTTDFEQQNFPTY